MGPTLNAGLNQHVDRPADHDEMLDLVAPHQQQLAAGIDRGLSTTPRRLSRGRKKPGVLGRPVTKALKAHTISAPSAITNRATATASSRKLRSTMGSVLRKPH